MVSAAAHRPARRRRACHHSPAPGPVPKRPRSGASATDAVGRGRNAPPWPRTMRSRRRRRRSCAQSGERASRWCERLCSCGRLARRIPPSCPCPLLHCGVYHVFARVRHVSRQLRRRHLGRASWHEAVAHLRARSCPAQHPVQSRPFRRLPRSRRPWPRFVLRLEILMILEPFRDPFRMFRCVDVGQGRNMDAPACRPW